MSVKSLLFVLLVAAASVRSSPQVDISGRIVTKTDQDELLLGQFIKTDCHKDSLSGRIVTRTDQDELLKGQVVSTICHKDSLSGRMVTRTDQD